MKRKKIFLILFFLLLTAGAVCAWFFGVPMQRRYSARGIHAGLPSFQPEKIAKITIRWRDVHSTLVLKNGRWVIEERGDRPASVPRISALLSSLNTLSPVKELAAASPDILRELHLVENDPEQIPGVRVTLSDAAGQEQFSILLGKGHFVRPEPGLPPSPDAEGRYVKINEKVYLLPVVLENCHPIPAAWVEPLRLHDLRRALRMTMQRFENSQGKPVWAVYRRSTAHPLTMSYPVGKNTDNRLLSGLAEQLSKAFTSDYFTPEKDQRIELKQRLTIHCADGFTYQLELFEGTERYDVAALQLQFEEKKVLRLPGETDEQFRIRCQSLAKRFEFESGYYAGQQFITGKELSTLLDVIPEKQTGKK